VPRDQMSAPGQTRKNSVGANVFPITIKSGHRSIRSHKLATSQYQADEANNDAEVAALAIRKVILFPKAQASDLQVRGSQRTPDEDVGDQYRLSLQVTSTPGQRLPETRTGRARDAH
jgi:hypothetical protein